MNSRSRNAAWRSRSSAEVGSSATISSGEPISARAAATRCCWPTLRLAAERPRARWASRPSRASRRAASASAVALGRGAPAALRREAQRQQHVVDHRAVGQQVEHLEDDAEVLGAEAVARRGAELGDVGAEDLDAPRLRREDAAQQAEERRLAAARRPDQQNALARGQGEVARRRARRRRGRARLKRTSDMRMMSDGGDGGLGRDDNHEGAPPAYIMPARSMRGLARVTSNLVCPLGVITIDVELLGAGEGAEIVELDRRDVGRASCTRTCTAAWNSECSCSACRPILGLARPWPSPGLGVLVVIVVLAFDRGPGLLDDAAGRGRELEKRERRRQPLLRRFDGRLLLARLGRVLEADDVGARHLQLHAQRACLPRAMLSVPRPCSCAPSSRCCAAAGLGQRHDGEAQERQYDHAHTLHSCFRREGNEVRRLARCAYRARYIVRYNIALNLAGRGNCAMVPWGQTLRPCRQPRKGRVHRV